MLDEKTVAARIAGEKQRCMENIAARTERPTKIWWLSFADGNKPKGSQFLGAIIIHANDFIEAITETHMLGINPGGECQGMQVPPEGELLVPIGEEWKYRLLSLQECEAFDAEMNKRLDAYDRSAKVIQ